MRDASVQTLVIILAFALCRVGFAAEPPSLSSAEAAAAAADYQTYCALCHGDDREGHANDHAPSLRSRSLMEAGFQERIMATGYGRRGTPMIAFPDTLSNEEINAVTAFLRTRATGWSLEKPVFRTPPSLDQYVLNPDAPDPDFDLRDGLYVMSADLDKALADGRKMVLLDTRVTSLWQMAHIEGAVPLPYYYNAFEKLANDLPADDTWIVTYCECPRAAAESVTKRLRAEGYKKTAVLYEGIMGWVALGYPVSRGESVLIDASL